MPRRLRADPEKQKCSIFLNFFQRGLAKAPNYDKKRLDNWEMIESAEKSL